MLNTSTLVYCTVTSSVVCILQDDDSNEIVSEDKLEECDSDRKLASCKLREILFFILLWQFSFTVSDAAVVALLHFCTGYFTCCR